MSAGHEPPQDHRLPGLPRYARINTLRTTFGAVKTRVGASCSHPGKRIAHEKDAISSNCMGIMGSFNHDIQGDVKTLYDESYCSSNCWVGCCPWGWSSRKKTRTQSCGYTSGGCSWVADCAYYFATVHLNYGDYL